MLKIIPPGAWANALLEDATHEAIIEEITQRTYDQNSIMLSIVLFLPKEKVHLTTALYFPNGASLRSQQRLWYLCNAIGLQQTQLVEDPSIAKGRRLCVELRAVQPSAGRSGSPHSDVRQFLPPARENESIKTDSPISETNAV